MFSLKCKEKLGHFANAIAALASVATAVCAVLFPPAVLPLGICSGFIWCVGVLFQYSADKHADKQKKLDEQEKKALFEEISKLRKAARAHEQGSIVHDPHAHVPHPEHSAHDIHLEHHKATQEHPHSEQGR